MHATFIYNLIQPCKNRGVKFENNGDGTVNLDGRRFETVRECVAYLETKPRKRFQRITNETTTNEFYTSSTDKEKEMTIIEFFDVNDEYHLKNYKYLCDKGQWNPDFYKQLEWKEIKFPVAWQMSLASKMANAYIELKLNSLI